MPTFDHIRAITLDLDDTLWPVWPIIARAEGALRQWLARHAPATERLYHTPEVLQHIRQRVNADWAHLAHDLSALRQESIRRALALAGDDAGLAPQAFAVFFAERQRVDLFDDALPALQRLSARFPLVAVSNGNADIATIGIAQYFKGAVSARSLGVAKPDPRIFVASARLVDAAPAQVLHVGDDVQLDVVGARSAGMATVWVNRKAEVWDPALAPPDVEVHTLELLCQLLGV
jgi:FMN hydrolase / 5-amino-6-(5-phospho-D-ribitylamino)uracil phosphatase